MESEFGKLIYQLKVRLSSGLPGDDAHQRLAPQHRKPASEYLKESTGYREAAVLALLFPDEKVGKARLVLIERSAGEGVHANQISFPGGKIEEGEEPLAAALRETQEEIGAEPAMVHVISPLSKLFIPPSNFLVHPFIGYMEHEPVFKLNAGEVKSVITPYLHIFSGENSIRYGEFPSARGYNVKAPFYYSDGHVIWGATAMMISEIADLLK